MTNNKSTPSDCTAPTDLAFEQLVYGMLLALEELFPGFIDIALKAAAGGGRISVDAELAFRDLAAHVRLMARRAGYLPPEESRG